MTVEMKQQTLPWNVTGIPAEARQLAREAATREGLSVGDWLTRRILNVTGRAAEGEDPEPLSPPALSTDDRALAGRVDRMEAEAQAAFRVIDESLRALNARLEATERSQVDAQRAMSTAAAEINAATQEQAQAFSSLTQRIERMERHSDGGPLRDAVRALHQALSRLAEQVAQSAAESAGQVNGIAGHVDSLAGQMTAAQNEISEQVRRTVLQNEELSARLHTAEERLTLITPLEDVVLQLQVRMTAVEGRLEETFDRGFDTITKNLDAIGARLERIERSHGEAGEAVRETIHTLHQRLDAMDARHGDSLSELRASLEAVSLRPDIPPQEIPTAPESPALAAEDSGEDAFISATEQAANPPPADDFGLPPFPDSPPVPTPAFVPTFAEEEFSEPPPAPAAREAEAVPVEELPPVALPEPDHYLLAARRAAKAAAEAETLNKSRSTLSTIRGNIAASRRDRSDLRRPLIIAALSILLAGVVAFFVGLNATPRPPASDAVRPAGVVVAPPLPPVQGPQAFAETPAQTVTTLPAPSANGFAAPAAGPDTAALATPTSPAPSAGPPAPAAETAPADRLLAKAKAGSPQAALLLGLKYLDGDGIAANDAEAVHWLTSAAQMGEALAQYRLGTLYERGRGVAADPRQAFFWYKQAAVSGNRKSMHNLAVAYADGLGTDKNLTEAARWFRQAGDYGLTDSQFNLAVLYERGLGVVASLGEAYKWYMIAAAGGDQEAKSRAEALASQLPTQQRLAAETAARNFTVKTADRPANEPPLLTDVAP